MDETPLTGRLFAEVVEYLYRGNCFMSGHLKISGRRARPDQVVAPLLSVVDKPCNLVPPEAILPSVSPEASGVDFFEHAGRKAIDADSRASVASFGVICSMIWFPLV